ncbi:MAG: DedA family protein [Proteobacteria bacterium]|nr:DedA family protein [Pseudomonadota bacterium]
MDLFNLILELFSETGTLILILPFFVLILCGLGLPLPEDIVLIFLGFLIYNGYGNLTFGLFLGYFGIIVGDSIIYLLGKKAGTKILKHKLFSKLLTKERLKKAKRFTIDHGKKTIFIARFLPGLRAAVFFSCGILKFKYRTFFIMDSVAALLSAPIFVILGYYFGDKIDYIIHIIKRIDRMVIILLISIILIVYLLKKYYNRKSKSSGENDSDKQINP